MLAVYEAPTIIAQLCVWKKITHLTGSATAHSRRLKGNIDY